MSVLLQVSDPHFGTDQPTVAEALVALAQREQPDLVVLSGDITQRATVAQFHAARGFMDRLGAPVLALPGNHDLPLFNLWVRCVRPYARFQAIFGPELAAVHESADWLVLGVNTTRPWRHKDGEVSDAQIEHVAARLRRATVAQLRVVVVHQPIAVVQPNDVPDRLHGHLAAQRRWADAGADLVMGGHIHRPYVMALQGLSRPLWAVQAGTALSTRVRAGVPNSVNVLRWGSGATVPGSCAIEQWDFNGASQAFERVATTWVEPGRG